MEIDPERFATVCKIIPGGEKELAEGSVAEILEALATGKIGRPGALFMRIEGQADPVLGRHLGELVEQWKLAAAPGG